jgi:hypothetical protein
MHAERCDLDCGQAGDDRERDEECPIGTFCDISRRTHNELFFSKRRRGILSNTAVSLRQTGSFIRERSYREMSL